MNGLLSMAAHFYLKHKARINIDSKSIFQIAKDVIII